MEPTERKKISLDDFEIKETIGTGIKNDTYTTIIIKKEINSFWFLGTPIEF